MISRVAYDNTLFGCSGAVAGLVVVTPGAGFVDQTGAFMMGFIGAPIIYWGIQVTYVLSSFLTSV
jgi:ammonia channel protein AmtB